jgi:alkyl sulfatase BDS1-like metallo-beta-lactamase superfamily hydrolase
MIIHHPGLRVLNMAEITSHNFHNLLPLRGAQVRDARAWAGYLAGARQRYAAHSDVLIAQHHWPVWGSQSMGEYLLRQHDLYKFVHDQTLRLMNHGHTGGDIAEAIRLPEALQQDWSTHSFYGHLKHNVKAVYQRYLSYYDGNPANLHRLPPVEAGRRWVEIAGGPDALLAAGRRAFEAGDYRWAAEVLNHLVFADPSHVAARELQADTLEQLGYQAESSTFRNAYLMGAQELRNGPPRPAGSPVRGRGLLMAMTVEQVFDTLAVRLMSENLAGVSVATNWIFTDTGERWTIGISHRTLFASPDSTHPAPDATVTLTRSELLSVIVQDTTFADGMATGRISVDGDAAALLRIFGNLDVFTGAFPIVEP